MGTIELTAPAVGFLIDLEPRFQVLDAAGLFDSVQHDQQVFTDPAIRKRLATFGASKGVEPLITYLNGPLMLLSHKPVRTLADIIGQKIRAPGGAPLHIEPFRKLGASPLSMPLGEVLPALQNHTIDGPNHLDQGDGRKVLAENFRVGISRRLLVVEEGLHVGYVHGHYGNLRRFPSGSLHGAFQVLHHLAELRDEIAFADDLSVFVERGLARDVYQFPRGDLGQVGVSNRFFQALGVDQFE